ncbi:MAG: DsbA family protein [Bacteroidota bacterium]
MCLSIMEENSNCDPETGVCTPASLSAPVNEQQPLQKDIELIYIGDPMCSWCWGISPALKQLKDRYRPDGIGFKIVVGGLRPGGGDPWDNNMKDFLKHHWQEVTARSGQPFGYSLFDRESFNYDTEPPCRAAVAARPLVGERELEFFTAIKKKFYVDSEDPGEEVFYQSICKDFDVDYEAFLTRFRSDEVKKATHNEFVLNRNWGVKGYPCLVLRKGQDLLSIANGFATFEQMTDQVDRLLSMDPATQG